MTPQRLLSLMSKRRCTLLGVGPMSINCVDTAIELASEHEIPLFLIASRRQIDSEEFGGGYVNNWTTLEYANYVKERDKKGHILLARDHGGPWQSPQEVIQKLTLHQAMESAKRSYKADIEAGFEAIHIDPSMDMYGPPSLDTILERVYELYEYCWQQSQRLKREIIFEIGAEEQSGGIKTPEELEYVLSAVQKFCLKNKLPPPSFVVIQTGTRVMETRNMGLDSFEARTDELPVKTQISKMLSICKQHNILMKEHNADYLSDEALQWHPELGIHAANVAPEFGVAETKSFLSLLDNSGLKKLADRFLTLSYESRKWEKWMLENTQASDGDRAVIAGHYVFSDPQCLIIKEEARHILQRKGLDLDQHLKQDVKRAIYRYLKNFRLVKDQ